MTFLKKLGDTSKVYDAFSAWPEIYEPWVEVCQQVLRDTPSNLSAGERELIGTFVSRLNRCDYCFQVHNSVTTEFGYDAGLVDRLKLDVDAADVDEKLKPLLQYVRKLTEDQHRMVQADADAVYAAGWTEDDLHVAIAICAMFNFMNRFVHGLGIEEDPVYSLAAGPRLKVVGYSGSSSLSKRNRDAYSQKLHAKEADSGDRVV